MQTKGRFQPGQSGNPAGRKKGSENKATASLRNAVREFITKNWKDIQKEYKQLESKDKLMFLEKLLSYALPKLQAVQMDNSIDIQSLPTEQLEFLFNKIMSEK